MDSGIAEVALTSGYEVLLRDMTQEVFEKERMKISTNLDKRVEKGKTALKERERCLQRLSTTTEMTPFRDCDFVIEAAKFLVYQAAWLADQGLKNTKQAAMAKAFASDVAMKVTTDAVQIYGGMGYTKWHPVEKLMRDAKVIQIYEGTAQIMRLIIARQLLREIESRLF